MLQKPSVGDLLSFEDKYLQEEFNLFLDSTKRDVKKRSYPDRILITNKLYILILEATMHNEHGLVRCLVLFENRTPTLAYFIWNDRVSEKFKLLA